MSSLRTILLVVILVGLAGLILQNLTPAISLVFLGLRSLTLPLGLWLVAAIAAGMVTGGVLALLLRLSGYWTQTQLRSRLRELETNPPRGSAWTAPASRTASASSRDRPPVTPRSSEYESSGDQEPVSTSKVYEVDQQPTTSYQAGSTYSYGYRKSSDTEVGRRASVSDSGVGRREPVVDADYRVIRPPSTQEPDDEDWFEDDDQDDFEDDRRYR